MKLSVFVPSWLIMTFRSGLKNLKIQNNEPAMIERHIIATALKSWTATLHLERSDSDSYRNPHRVCEVGNCNTATLHPDSYWDCITKKSTNVSKFWFLSA